MKYIFAVFTIALLGFCPQWADAARLATSDDIALLKSDIVAGKIKTVKTRMRDIQRVYGEPQTIQDSDRKVVYDYGDLKLEFNKKYYLRDWQYDYSHKSAYSSDINDLRKDLESGQIVGNWMELNDNIISDYVEPTEAFVKTNDGDLSVYYWGEMRLAFENYFALTTIRGQNLGEQSGSQNEAGLSIEKGVLSSKPLMSSQENANAAPKVTSDPADGTSVTTDIR